MNILGQIVKDARQSAGLTQDELAEQSGITTRYIMAIENENRQPSMKVLFKLIRALKISADTIFYPEIQHTDKKKEHLIHMIQLCDERETNVATATIRALLDSR
ncbi:MULTISPECIES: helix-turn-helix transcriptional regulator [Caproicibacterium]|jgi:transcriptional regulator with XRE-family HTH domain|uniref:Helix-turn-helix transcriptional regulator n=1 Tax=Caproicibacterium argilliputei TaxID=3030016 RepID=A0AA97D8B4_9FIRM|nr:helix-turn-helix transcriptional regulator [Caproicibacterium argilliputei]MDD3230309.1 helix-turn-helix transcriptional regulator [Oscillospiraceae bacterium]MDD4509782.1 helix-turn-helix transcriptional regulator [Oscillospiraceae bacterium]WOC32096.1 helix-turn-helix transcriptional regulator [Caproicibacterium argilliputei]